MNTLTIRAFSERISVQIPVVGLVTLLVALMLMSFFVLLSSMLGSFDMSVIEVWQALIGQSLNEQHQIVLWEFRIPRSLVAIFSGALFALSGAMLQSFTRNALADPSLIGISQGASLAVVALVVLFPELGGYWREVSAFIGSLLVAVLIRFVAGQGNSLKFILLGIGVAAFITALTQIMLTYSDVESAMSALAWLAGSVNSATWTDVSLLGMAAVILLIVYLAQSRVLSPLSLGAETATGLGVRLIWVNNNQLVSAVLAAALATAVVGPLGFVGLLSPHLTRSLIRTGPALFLMITALVGALMVLVADLIGRMLFAPIQLPAGLLTSIIGAPVFIALMMKSSTHR